MDRVDLEQLKDIGCLGYAVNRKPGLIQLNSMTAIENLWNGTTFLVPNERDLTKQDFFLPMAWEKLKRINDYGNKGVGVLPILLALTGNVHPKLLFLANVLTAKRQQWACTLLGIALECDSPILDSFHQCSRNKAWILLDDLIQCKTWLECNCEVCTEENWMHCSKLKT